MIAVPSNRLRFADVGQGSTRCFQYHNLAHIFIQVGINLGDPIFRGVYHDKQVHDDDLEDILQRAVEAGCVKLMVTGSDLDESKKAVKIAQEHRGWL